MKKNLYFEDFHPGQTFDTASYDLSVEASKAFAQEYDPQYFHLDEETAKDSPFGGFVASGWHTAAITMRLKAGTDLTNVSGGLVGLGLEYVKWPRPVYPPDTLHARITVIEARRSTSKPTHGVVKYKMETFNSKDELVMEMVTAVWVPCRMS